MAASNRRGSRPPARWPAPCARRPRRLRRGGPARRCGSAGQGGKFRLARFQLGDLAGVVLLDHRLLRRPRCECAAFLAHQRRAGPERRSGGPPAGRHGRPHLAIGEQLVEGLPGGRLRGPPSRPGPVHGLAAAEPGPEHGALAAIDGDSRVRRHDRRGDFLGFRPQQLRRGGRAWIELAQSSLRPKATSAPARPGRPISPHCRPSKVPEHPPGRDVAGGGESWPLEEVGHRAAPTPPLGPVQLVGPGHHFLHPGMVGGDDHAGWRGWR